MNNNTSTPPFVIIAVANIPFIVTSVIGNALILVTFARNPSLRSPSNVLLIGLALSDVLVGLIIQPLYVVKVFHQHSMARGGIDTLNALVTFFSYFLCAVSFQTVTLLSIDRLLALYLHLRYQEFVTVRRVAGLLAIVWVCNGVFSCVLLNFPGYSDYFGAPFACLCLAVNALLYFKVYRVVRRHQQQISIQLHSQSNEHTVSMVRFRKTFISMFYVYFVFLLSYIPYLATTTTIIISSGPEVPDSLILPREISFTIVYINSSLNPLLFSWKLSDIRAAVKCTVRDAFACLL